MTIETEVAALTTATTALLAAVNVNKATLDTSVTNATTQVTLATDQVALATTQKTLATTQATNAATSATTATTQAGIATTQAAAATAAAVGASNIVLGVSTLYPAIRPSLDLDFANGQTVDPRITFTRASTATRTNSRGLIEAVASGVPRIDFDAVTGVCRGLLIEEQRANLLTYSEQFDNAAWIKNAVTVTTNATTAPDGALTADKLVESVANSTHSVYQGGVGVVSGTAYTYAVFVKAAERTKFEISFNSNSSAFADSQASFDLVVGTSSSTNTLSHGIRSFGNGWFLCWATEAATASANCVIELRVVAATAIYTGDGTSGLFIWGAQLEAGAFPTSYIPTVASQVTRAADVASMTGANFSSWYRSDEGSFVAIASAAFDSSSTIFPHYLTVSDGTLSNRIGVGQRTNDDTILGTIVVSGVSQADFSATSSAVYGSANNVALAYKVNDAAIARSSVLSQTDSSLTLPTVNQMSVGSSVGVNVLNGHIRSISYYNRRLTNAELQALSTQ